MSQTPKILVAIFSLCNKKIKMPRNNCIKAGKSSRPQINLSWENAGFYSVFEPWGSYRGFGFYILPCSQRAGVFYTALRLCAPSPCSLTCRHVVNVQNTSRKSPLTEQKNHNTMRRVNESSKIGPYKSPLGGEKKMDVTGERMFRCVANTQIFSRKRPLAKWGNRV